MSFVSGSDASPEQNPLEPRSVDRDHGEPHKEDAECSDRCQHLMNAFPLLHVPCAHIRAGISAHDSFPATCPEFRLLLVTGNSEIPGD